MWRNTVLQNHRAVSQQETDWITDTFWPSAATTVFFSISPRLFFSFSPSLLPSLVCLLSLTKSFLLPFSPLFYGLFPMFYQMQCSGQAPIPALSLGEPWLGVPLTLQETSHPSSKITFSHPPPWGGVLAWEMLPGQLFSEPTKLNEYQNWGSPIWLAPTALIAPNTPHTLPLCHPLMAHCRSYHNQNSALTSGRILTSHLIQFSLGWPSLFIGFIVWETKMLKGKVC